MSDEDNPGTIRTTSKVLTRSGEKDGIFVRESTTDTTPTQYRDWLMNFPSSEGAVRARIVELEAISLQALRKCGYRSWSENVLVVDGKRHTGKIPEEYWSTRPFSERSNEILKELGIHEKLCVRSSAGSVHEPLSLGDFANRLNNHCGQLRVDIEKQDFWNSLSSIVKAEDCYCKIVESLMEDDYVRGKAQRGRYQTDWDIVLSDWAIERPNHKNNSACDRAMCEKYGIAKADAVRKQRNLKKK